MNLTNEQRNQAHDRALGLISKQVLPVVTDTGVQGISDYTKSLARETNASHASAKLKKKRN